VRAAAWCWGASTVAGGVALVAAVLDLAEVRRRLVDAAAAADPGTAEDLLRQGADTAVVAVLGSLTVLVVLGLVALLLHLRRRKAWTRVLMVLGLLTAGVDVLAQDLLGGGPEVDRVAVLAQGGFVVAALVLLLFPSARTWSRSGR
jgi:uncharacterized membrane protein